MSEENVNLKLSVSGASQAQSSIAGVGGAVKGLVGAYLSWRTISAGASFAKDAVLTYKKEAEGIEELSVMLSRITPQYKELTATIADYAEKQQYKGVLEDEAIVRGQRTLAGYVKNSTQMKELGNLVNDLAAKIGGKNATEQDAVTAAEMIGKAMQGQSRGLKMLGISLSDATLETIKLKGVSDEAAKAIAGDLTKAVGGLSEKMGTTSFQKLERSLSDFKAALGKGIAPGLSGLADQIGAMVKDPSLMSRASSVGNSIGSFISDAIKIVVPEAGLQQFFADAEKRIVSPLAALQDKIKTTTDPDKKRILETEEIKASDRQTKAQTHLETVVKPAAIAAEKAQAELAMYDRVAGTVTSAIETVGKSSGGEAVGTVIGKAYLGMLDAFNSAVSIFESSAVSMKQMTARVDNVEQQLSVAK